MDLNLKAMLVAFMIVVLGAAFLTTVADETTEMTQTNTVTNESATLTNNTATTLANNQLGAVTRVGNASLTIAPSFYDVNLDTGTITARWAANATLANRAYDVSYTWREVGNSTARTLINTIVLFFALGMVLIVVAIFMPRWKEELMDRFGK